MVQSVLVIHGAGEPRRWRGKVYWEPLLGDALGRGYRVQAPRMPRPTHPRYWTWARRIDEMVADHQRPILVGHSFGASMVLKYLAETVRRPPLAGLFLLATPFWGPDKERSVQGLGPGPEDTKWGTREFGFWDPHGNALTFYVDR